MDALALFVGAAILLRPGYLLYGRWLSRRLFQLDDASLTPAITQEDGPDCVLTKRAVFFGRHFTSIAGAGPIVLWPLFGATNQLLAGFSFVVITAWLAHKTKRVWMIAPQRPSCSSSPRPR